jgi:hypothetical protein
MVSIPYWLGSKLRVAGNSGIASSSLMFQSPIGWGLSCEAGTQGAGGPMQDLFQSPIGWGLSCEFGHRS